MELRVARRAFVGASGIFAADAALLRGLDIFRDVAIADTQAFAADKRIIEGWMNQWISNSKKPIGALHVGRFADPIYYVITPITWTPNLGQEEFQPVTVPVGFVTDFASIPRLFWTILRPDGNYTYPAIVHDYLYWIQTTPREVADKILNFGMGDFAIDAVSCTSIYDAVHLFGWVAWNENKRLKGLGQRRILKRFPDDPTITWDEWRKRPDVFE